MFANLPPNHPLWQTLGQTTQAAAPTWFGQAIPQLPGGGSDPMALYNYASQNMPQWAAAAGVTPEAYAAYLNQNQQSRGYQNFLRSAAPSFPGSPGQGQSYGNDMISRPVGGLTPTTQVFPAPGSPVNGGMERMPGGVSPSMAGSLVQGAQRMANRMPDQPPMPGALGALQRKPPARPRPQRVATKPLPTAGSAPGASAPPPAQPAIGSNPLGDMTKPYYPGGK